MIRPVNETISCELGTKFKDVDDMYNFWWKSKNVFGQKEIWTGLTVGLYLFEFQSFGSSIIDLENLKKILVVSLFFSILKKKKY